MFADVAYCTQLFCLFFSFFVHLLSFSDCLIFILKLSSCSSEVTVTTVFVQSWVFQLVAAIVTWSSQKEERWSLCLGSTLHLVTRSTAKANWWGKGVEGELIAHTSMIDHILFKQGSTLSWHKSILAFLAGNTAAATRNAVSVWIAMEHCLCMFFILFSYTPPLQ